MKTSVICIFVLFLCSVGSSTKAATMMTAGELLKNCNQVVALDAAADQSAYMGQHGFEIGICLGFITGWMQGVRGLVTRMDNQIFLISFDDDVTVGQIVRVFVVHMQKHPELENKSGDYGVGNAATDAKLMTFTPVKGPIANASAQ